ncbi:MAG: sigma-70 family RNA polymerase sigma factor [Verrucomicrobiota bacterium]
MQQRTDSELLREYARDGAEGAFREIVERHTDLVYSAALRHLSSTSQAGDVAQEVFSDLVRKAPSLADRLPAGASLAGWLFRSTRFAALNQLREDRRRAARERQAMDQSALENEPGPDWEQLRPMLDEVMDGLDDDDREALLLRYFKNQDYRSVGIALGVSDDAAQKRVSRALDRLRDALGRRGLAAGPAGLAILLSTHAVQAAPQGFAAVISAGALAGAATQTTLLAATGAIAMTATQKILVTLTISALAGAGLYQAQRASTWKHEAAKLQQEQAPVQAELQAVRQQRDAASNQVAALSEEIDRLKKNPSEVLKLRGEVGRLRQETASNATNSMLNKLTGDPAARKLLRDQQKAGMSAIFKEFAKRAGLDDQQAEKFNELLTDNVMDNIDRIQQVLREGKSPEQMVPEFDQLDAGLRQQLQAMLGPDAYAQYQDYQRNLLSYLSSEQFKPMLAGDPAADDKTHQIYAALQAETQAALAAAGLSPDYQAVPILNFRNIASTADAERSIQLLNDIYTRALQRLNGVLTPDQIEKFKGFQATALANTRAALAMNRRIMGPAGQ